jgi:hypothetical protein
MRVSLRCVKRRASSCGTSTSAIRRETKGKSFPEPRLCRWSGVGRAQR